MTEREKNGLQLIISMTLDYIYGKIDRILWLKNMKLYTENWEQFIEEEVKIEEGENK